MAYKEGNMKKLLRKLTAFVSAAAVVTVGGIIGLSALAQGDGVQTTLDISQGNITITADSVSGYDSSGNAVTATDPDGYIITGSTTSNTVTVSGTQKITLDNATINVSGIADSAAFKIENNNTGDITLTLVGTNSLTSGINCAGLQKNVDADGSGKLIITGSGSLSANGGDRGAGIGGGENCGTGNIEINGGAITAVGSDGGAGVGSGFYTYTIDTASLGTNVPEYPYSDNLVISGGSLKAVGSGKEEQPAVDIGIGVRCKKSYSSASFQGTSYQEGYKKVPVSSADDGKNVYLLKIAGTTVMVDGAAYTPIDGTVYAYLTEGEYTITVGDVTTTNRYYANDQNELVAVGTAFTVTATDPTYPLNYGWDYTYPADTGVLTVLSGKEITISNTDKSNSTTDTIVVEKDLSANITLDGVNIDVSGTESACAFKIADDSEGNVTITLADGSENTLTSGSNCAGLQKNGENGTLEIKGTTGTLTATGGTNGAGIGGGNGSEGSGIIINGGSVKAVAGTGANAIGGGEGKDPVTPTNGNCEPVYLLKITGTSVTVDNVAYTPIDDTVYAYLTEGDHTVIADGDTTTNHYLANAQNKLEAIGTAFTITTDSGELVYGKDYTYPADTGVLTILSDKAVTISGSTETDTIVVAKDVSANIALNGVNIDVWDIEGKAAFEIAPDSKGNVTITLAESNNLLQSGSGCAGLQKNGSFISANEGKLTITGEGSLIAKGHEGGAGIGGGKGGNGSNITISGDYIYVEATGGTNGAGIGGGSGDNDSEIPISCGNGSNITISGGTVDACGGGGAGIGGGSSGSGSYITISGGIVTATHSTSMFYNGGAGIGGGNGGSGSDITISGGTVNATGGDDSAGIGGGKNSSGSNIIISGGSVKAVAGSEANSIGGGYNGGGAVTPTNGTSKVYLLTIANPTSAAVKIDGVVYTYANHSAADANDTNLYAYLTGADHSITVGEKTTDYKFYDGIFLPVPTVSDFTFTAPDNLKYTGTAKTATVTTDKTGIGEITVKYFNSSGVEVTQGADFVPDTYTVKIDVAKGEKYAAETFTKDDWKFTITKGDLTASGTGKASGTFGDKLSELIVSGLTVKLGEIETEGTWVLSGSDVPNVGDTTKYTATFIPSENPTYYNELTAEVSLDIAKADAPAIEDIEQSYTWAITGEKTATVSGLPDNMGTIGTTVIEITDTNGIIKENSAVYGKGELRYTLNGFDSENKDISATIKVTLPSQNYKDTTFSVIVKITEKANRTAPAESDFELSVDLQSNNSYKATIKTELTGVEYSFDGTTWSSTNTTAVNHGETVKGYIRYAETLKYKASAAVSQSSTTAHGILTHHDPKAATCTEDGNIEYWTCDSCVKYFSDTNGTAEITAEKTVVGKLDHKWAEKYNFDKGGHWQTCEHCGEKTEAKAHISGGEATAEKAEICTTCGYEIAPKIGQTAAPLFSPNGGKFGSIQKVSITCATAGATIYYTTDGSEPTTESTKYTTELTIDKTTTIKAIAVKDEMKNSKVVIADFTIILPVAVPVITPNGSSFSSSQKVTITCATEGAAIYYTTDGTFPKTTGTLYEDAFTITENTTIRAIAVKEGMTDSSIVSATFTKRSSSGGTGGSSGGGSSGGGSSRPTTPTTTNPSIGGSSKSWSDVAADLGRLTNGSEATLELNGNTTVPVEVIKAIADKDSKVTFVINSVFSWVVDGSQITNPVAIDLTLIKIASTKSDSLRGIEGTQFKINGTNIPTDLMIAFRKEHEGKFANLYKNVSGKLVFVTCAKIGEDGKAILPDVTEKGDYVVMLCEFSDRPGDMDNNGVMNVMDAVAILKDIVEIEPGKNPLMADFNGDEKLNVMDAVAILKRIVGLA